MTPSQVDALLLRELRIRVGPAMAEYVARRIADARDGRGDPIPVFGGDARTGVPVRLIVDPQTLLDRAQP